MSVTEKFKKNMAFLEFLEKVKKMKKKDFDKLMYTAWMRIWRTERPDGENNRFEENFK